MSRRSFAGRVGVQAREGDQLEHGLREREPERLVPPPGPPPSEPAVQPQVSGCVQGAAHAPMVGAEDAAEECGVS